MSLYRLERYSTGDGDPIDTSDALSILREVEEIKRQEYNAGLDTAIDLVRQSGDYESRMTGLIETIVMRLENSKKE